MKKYAIATMSVMILSACACAASSTPQKNEVTAAEIAEKTVVVSTDDFYPLIGTGWSGKLSYLDYTSEKRTSIPIELSVDQPKKKSIAYNIIYPNESQYNSREKIRITKNGTYLNGDRVISRTKLDDGSIKIVTFGGGEDNNRSATIRMRYTISTSSFKIGKDVKFSDSTEFFNRNEYAFTR